MAERRPRILFIAEAVTLAHVARPYVLARGLDPARYEVFFATDPRYARLFNLDGLQAWPQRSIPSEQFLAALAAGRPLYERATLRGYVQDDLALLRELAPDLVVGDFRLSLAVSAPLAGVPYATISNAYWSPYSQPRYIVPELPFVSYVGAAVAQALFNAARPLAFARHCGPLNGLRREHGLPGLGHDLRTVYTHADHTCYADLPELVPTEGLPAHHHYLGPIIWSPAVPVPAWWSRLPEGRPVIYVTMGSSGESALLPVILAALADVPVTVMVATGARGAALAMAANVYVADYLPGAEAAARAALVICNGGSPTAYQALAAGVPVLGLPSNLDQYLNMDYLARSGAGLWLRAGQATAESVRGAARRLLYEPAFRQAAQRLQSAITDYQPAARFAALVEQWVKRI